MAIFERIESGEVHIIDIPEDGKTNHFIEGFCRCFPIVEVGDGYFFVYHQPIDGEIIP